MSSSKVTKGGSSKRTTGSKTDHLKRKKESSSAMDSNLSQTSTSTIVVVEIHKEDQQTAGGPISLGVTSEEGTHSQLSSAEADPEISAPNDYVPQQQGTKVDTRSAFMDDEDQDDETFIIPKESSVENAKRNKDTHTKHKRTLFPPPSPPTVEALLVLLNKVTDTLSRFASILNAHNKGVPSIGKSTASPTKGEKNTNLLTEDANLANLIDLMGVDVAEAITTTCYTKNQSLICKRHNETLYELIHNRKPYLSYLHVFGSLCYLTNDSEDLGPEPQLLTPRTISFGRVSNPPSPTQYVPPTKKDWDILFQPMFNKYLNHPPSVASLVLAVAASEPVDSTGTPSSTTNDQDAPPPSTSQTPQETQSPVIPFGVKEQFHDIEVARIDNDLYFGALILEPNSKESSLMNVITINVHSVNQPTEHLKIDQGSVVG
uniref:Integrase, catalytic region, zinc finger, CCHC-type, peptidase aspartic, catalytic n=1 Tax=Tanacetum cinerariifolium TaxID=118510 RepID=A0A6L2KNU7_TANCI|nr:integrase, catalytic region, zinc finger, CCHC-type, peptidase aspartic, catalytic [Tanacetum cinerariifolium]